MTPKDVIPAKAGIQENAAPLARPGSRSRSGVAASKRTIPGMPPSLRRPLRFLLSSLAGLLLAGAAVAQPFPKEDGYRGLWYSNQPDSSSPYRFKYSGGLATYPQQHIPIAIYSPEAHKTFFCYGGAEADRNTLVYAVSYFDHATGLVPRPTRLAAKATDDAHDNPVLSIDGAGYLFVFLNAHGTARPSAVWRSTKPYSIEAFEQVLDSVNFSYAQPWFLPEHGGFLWLRTQYGGLGEGRSLFWTRSPDGRTWTEPQPLAHIEEGNYQISWPKPDGAGLGTAFDYHPAPFGEHVGQEDYRGLNWRSNIYYLETDDLGTTWTSVDGTPVETPLASTTNPALAYDSRQDNQLVYLKDLAYDDAGRPVILFLLSQGYEAGPENGPRTWHTLRWDGAAWQRSPPITTSDNNYDHGSLYLEEDGTWRIIAPTATGPQAYNPGGEMVMWTSTDHGQTWEQAQQITHDSPFNYTYARRPLHAHPDFYALWADGHGREPSASRLYFTGKAGDRVWQLPETMEAPFAKPEPVSAPHRSAPGDF